METQVKQNIGNCSVVRMLLVFVAGFLLGFLIFYLFRNSFVTSISEQDALKGSLYDSRSYDNMKLADNLLYEDANSRATIAVKYSPKVAEARIALNSSEIIRLVAEFSYTNFSVMNVQPLTANDQCTITSGGNFIQIENVGDNQYVIQLYNKNTLPNQISFRIYRDDFVLYQNAVTVNKE